MNSSVKRSKDGENNPPRITLSKFDESAHNSRNSYKQPESIVLPITCSEITSKEWNEDKEIEFTKSLQNKMI